LVVKAFIQGLYSNGEMTPTIFNLGMTTDPTAVDSVTIELRDANGSHALVQTRSGIIHKDGTVQLQFESSAIGNSYYIVIRNRNSIETWSKNPVLISNSTTVDFTAP
jgi:hypothetical protein